MEDAPTLDEILERVSALPGVTVERSPDAVSIKSESEDGFDVQVYFCDDETVVSFGGWHEQFEDKADALRCLAFAFSDRCRLKVTYRGRVAHKWTLQSFEDGAWQDDSSVGLMFFPYWAKRRVVYRQNRSIWTGPSEP